VGIWGVPAVLEQKNNDPLSLFVTTWTSDRIRDEKGAKASGLRDIHTPHTSHGYCTAFFQGAKHCTCTYLSVSQIATPKLNIAPFPPFMQ
jgi:hypothetical protein